jgi:hypothetical protein
MTLGMEPDTVYALHQLQSSDRLLSNNLRFSDNMVRELKAVLAAHVEHCLGKKPKSARYFM